jgi:glycosyltransferase involved in cell wall biosynthesis
MARGVQNKLLEALAMGLPCVASTTAASGTVIPNGKGILAADEPEEFAEYVLRLLLEEQFRAEMAQRARHAAETYYRWDSQMADLDRVIASLASRPAVLGSPECA